MEWAAAIRKEVDKRNVELFSPESWHTLGQFFGESPESLKAQTQKVRKARRTSSGGSTGSSGWDVQSADLVSPSTFRAIMEAKDMKIKELEQTKHLLETELMASRNVTPTDSPQLTPAGSRCAEVGQDVPNIRMAGPKVSLNTNGVAGADATVRDGALDHSEVVTRHTWSP